MKPLIPVLTLNSLASVEALAEVLLQHDLTTIEVTLRTEEAFKAISILSQHPQLQIWAGSVRTAPQARMALDAGASRLVSPGFTPSLMAEVMALKAAWLPGVQTVSEVMQLAEQGFVHQKFFPAQAAGGLPWLKAIQGPIPEVSFCPSGGIDMTDVGHFLHQSNVFALALSKLVPSDCLIQGNLDALDKKLAMRLHHLREIEHEL